MEPTSLVTAALPDGPEVDQVRLHEVNDGRHTPHLTLNESDCLFDVHRGVLIEIQPTCVGEFLCFVRWQHILIRGRFVVIPEESDVGLVVDVSEVVGHHHCNETQGAQRQLHRNRRRVTEQRIPPCGPFRRPEHQHHDGGGGEEGGHHQHGQFGLMVGVNEQQLNGQVHHPRDEHQQTRPQGTDEEGPVVPVVAALLPGAPAGLLVQERVVLEACAADGPAARRVEQRRHCTLPGLAGRLSFMRWRPHKTQRSFCRKRSLLAAGAHRIAT
mmetsp:Transcript_27165/g.67763  ORF Transcript_27165/g.67763 Transcript_27165/m.67763 type:complete len:270 (-) Transcript_27165:4-813(-)